MEVLGGSIACAWVGGITFDDGAVDVFDELLDILGAQIVLITVFARVELDSDGAWQIEMEDVVNLDEAVR